VKADSIHLFDFLENSKTIFEIPVFQRNYEWGAQQCSQLFNDLTTAAEHDRDHFIGAIVYVTETGKKMSHIYRIIDGQQRLMSLMLLLKAISDMDERDQPEITESYLTNKYLEENNHLKLKPVEHDEEAFVSVMNENEGSYQGPSKVIENYHLFQKLIDKSGLSASELYEALNHFNMVYIELSSSNKDENPQVIFESLNSTGVSLSSSDLVRNFLLMKLNSEDQNRLYKEYWSKIEQIFTTKTFAEFIRGYLIMQTHKLVNRNKVYQAYKDFYINSNLNSEDALSNLYRFATYYNELLTSHTESKSLNKILNHINIMDSKVVFPYFMLLLSMHNNDELDWDQIVSLAKVMESYLFRLKACRRPTNGLNRIVIALCDVEKANNDLRSRELKLLRNNFPTDREVMDSLAEVNLYKQRNNLAKLSLVILEEHRTKETINFDNAQVEHIMPQRLNNDWRIAVPNADKINGQLGGTIGNLTLTKYNQEMGNRPFNEKKGFYRESNVSLTREIATKYQKWDRDSISDRTKELSEELISIFPKPQIRQETTNDILGEHSINDSIDITGKKPVRITIDNKDFNVDSWRQMLISFLNYIWEQDSLSYERIKKDRSLDKMLFESNRRPEKLQNGIQIETNFSANVILALISKIADICDISDEVSYTIK